MSIRSRLTMILAITTGAVWLFAVVWIYASTQVQVEKVLDARLIEAAKMVSSLIADHRVDVASAANVPDEPSGNFEIAAEEYHHQLSCQIWSLEGTMVGRSQSAPATRLSEHESGFADSRIDGEQWRVYAVTNPDLGVRVLVGDNLNVRDKLVNDVVKGLILPASAVLPVMALMIWASVGRGLSPLNRMAESLSSREATDLHPLPETPSPAEIRPVATALNGLFRRVAEARERERNFTAFAAHELKTPLAGLKTHAQIAAAAPDETTRKAALAQISKGIDRTGRLVRQLLAMASAESDNEEEERRPVAFGEIVEGVASDLEGLCRTRDVKLELFGTDIRRELEKGRGLATLALRNVIENAIQYSPQGGTVACTVREEPDGLSAAVADRGPGLSEAEIAHVTERFYRGARPAGAGSGLGLSITETAVNRLGGTLAIRNRSQGGLEVTIAFPGSIFAPAGGRA